MGKIIITCFVKQREKSKMVIYEWNQLVVRRYWDEEQQKFIEVRLIVKDAIFFDYLNRIIGAIKRIKT